MNIAFAVTGSFCTHEKILQEIENLAKKGHNIFPVFTPSVLGTDTRFGKAQDFKEKVEKICNKKVIETVVQAEPLGPSGKVDILVVAPCTGNTLAKLALGISDNAVTMIAKSLLRNDKPVVIGISTNDALSQNATNVATLLSTKNFFFVPFGQDDFEKKPKSLVADFSKIEETILQAKNHKQIQPLLLK